MCNVPMATLVRKKEKAQTRLYIVMKLKKATLLLESTFTED